MAPDSGPVGRLPAGRDSPPVTLECFGWQLWHARCHSWAGRNYPRPESGRLLTLRVQPGEDVSCGAVIGQMGNLEIEEQLVQVQAELAGVNAEYSRAHGELRWREATARRATGKYANANTTTTRSTPNSSKFGRT